MASNLDLLHIHVANDLVHKIVTTSIASSAPSSQSASPLYEQSLITPVSHFHFHLIAVCSPLPRGLPIPSVHPSTSCMCRPRCMKVEYLFQMMKVGERYQRKVQNLGPASAQFRAVGSNIMQLQPGLASLSCSCV